MKRFSMIPAALLLGAALLTGGCSTKAPEEKAVATTTETGDFQVVAERFADLRVLRYEVPGFDELSLEKKKLLYYLYEAALSGRDIIWDQNFKYNLTIRRTLEAIVESNPADSPDFQAFVEYTKRVWFSNGIHHHYANDKFKPGFTETYFAERVRAVDPAKLPLANGESVDAFITRLTPILFNPAIAAKRVNTDPSVDVVTQSAANFYEGLTQEEVDAYYAKKIDKNDKSPISYGLNSKLVKVNGKIEERVWKVGGMYSAAIEKVVFWLEKAASVAETPEQKRALEKLIEYYKTGDLEVFDEYSIAWVQDTASDVDVINGFIEVYTDSKGFRGSYESVVSIRDPEATRRIEAIGKEAQWFEDHSPIMDAHKKENVQGISARVINVVVESGDASPTTPIGINLPNSTWIRADHGSKSVNLANIVSAYEKAASTSGGYLDEFAPSPQFIELQKKYGSLSDNLHTDMHEVIGHASGKINAGVGTTKETLKTFNSTIEEGRADLVALYYLMDPKLVELGLMESLDVGRAGYDDYILNGMMTQLRRIKLGDDIEESHMRNRAWVSWWSYEQGKKDNVIELFQRDGKTFVRINNYEKLREIFGQLLRETQRITSEGDYAAAKKLVETYGVKVDQKLHKEVLDRFERLNIPPYNGFINPMLVPVMKDGEITDVKIEYPTDFTKQMLYYAKNYSFLPSVN